VTRIDFYILQAGAPGNRFALTCRLVEKALTKQRRVYIHTDSERDGRHMDRLLWTFRDGSFIPHGILGEVAAELNPVLIGWGEDPGAEDDVLLNLADAVPPFFGRFQRVAELIDHDARVRESGRTRFRFYRDRGYPLESHTIAR